MSQARVIRNDDVDGFELLRVVKLVVGQQLAQPLARTLTVTSESFLLL